MATNLASSKVMFLSSSIVYNSHKRTLSFFDPVETWPLFDDIYSQSILLVSIVIFAFSFFHICDDSSLTSSSEFLLTPPTSNPNPPPSCTNSPRSNTTTPSSSFKSENLFFYFSEICTFNHISYTPTTSSSCSSILFSALYLLCTCFFTEYFIVVHSTSWTNLYRTNFSLHAMDQSILNEFSSRANKSHLSRSVDLLCIFSMNTS